MKSISGHEFRQLCQEAMSDPRSVDPTALLLEILARVRALIGDPDPRGAVAPLSDVPLTEGYRLLVERTIKSNFEVDFDIDDALNEVMRENSEKKLR